jgi:hypothetical protein
MANVNVTTGSSRLNHSVQNLLDKWEDTREVWNDDVRRDFEDRQIRPLEAAVDSALNGMRALAEVLDRLKADCADRQDSW